MITSSAIETAFPLMSILCDAVQDDAGCVVVWSMRLYLVEDQ